MTVTITFPTAADGYWTIQVVNRDRGQIGRRYVCHAHDDAEAQAIAGQLAGSAIGIVGYDYHRIDNPHGRYARTLAMGQWEIIDSPDTWAVLQSARRSA
jgi:hypothetical protein